VSEKWRESGERRERWRERWRKRWRKSAYHIVYNGATKNKK
jgi:hypothetical protein